MGRNNDYADDVLLTEEPIMMEDSDDESIVELDPQSWQDLNSSELLNTYYALEEYHQANGIYFNMTYNQFCHLAYTSKFPDVYTNDREHTRNLFNIFQRGLNNYRDSL